jgi:excisionase family DNA binding protein
MRDFNQIDLPSNLDGARSVSLPNRLAYSVENTAKRLDVGRTTIFELIRTGRLRAVKLGKRTIITDDAVRELLDVLPPAA